MRSTKSRGTLYPTVFILWMILFAFANFALSAVAFIGRGPDGEPSHVASYSLHRYPDHRMLLYGAMVLNLLAVFFGTPEAWRAVRGKSWRAHPAGQVLGLCGILALFHIGYGAVTLWGQGEPLAAALIGRANLGVIGAFVCFAGAAWCFRYDRTSVADRDSQATAGEEQQIGEA